MPTKAITSTPRTHPQRITTPTTFFPQDSTPRPVRSRPPTFPAPSGQRIRGFGGAVRGVGEYGLASGWVPSQGPSAWSPIRPPRRDPGPAAYGIPKGSCKGKVEGVGEQEDLEGQEDVGRGRKFYAHTL